MFPDGALGVQAAMLGHGVALGDRLINSEDLRSGRLVMPFEIEVALRGLLARRSGSRCAQRTGTRLCRLAASRRCKAEQAAA